MSAGAPSGRILRNARCFHPAWKCSNAGFMTLLLRSLMLWGRGFDPTFSLWILGPKPTQFMQKMFG